jgi:aspartyl protease family protein
MSGLNNDDLVRLLYLVLLLLFVLGGFRFRHRLGNGWLRNLAFWALLLVALVAAYAYREPLLRFAAPVLQELSPSRVVEVTSADGASELMIARSGDGHFHVEADVNGVQVRFLVDTGATATVLTLADAERVGIDTATLEFDRPVQTANGIAFYARAAVDALEIGPYRVSPLTVGVMPQGSIDTSLLGMNVIDSFSGWRIEGDRMMLVP